MTGWDLNPPREQYGEEEAFAVIDGGLVGLCKVKQHLPTLLDVVKEIES